MYLQKLSLTERRKIIGRMILEVTNKRAPLTQSDLSRLRMFQEEIGEIESDIQREEGEKHRRAFRNWLRKGLVRTSHFDGVTPEERQILENRDMGTDGTGAGPTGVGAGNFVPIGFVDQVESAMRDAGAMARLSTIVRTPSGAPLAFPAVDDTTVVAEQINESSQVTDADVAGLIGTNLKSFKYSSKLVKCSMELVQDTGFDLESFLAQEFGKRLARCLNPLMTHGAGTTEPFGVLTQASSGATAAGANTNDGTSAANTIGTDDVASLIASVDSAYHRNASFQVHANTLAALRKVKDKEGRPVFCDLHCGGENRIMNFPVDINPDLDQLQTQVGSPPVSKKTMLFGDCSKYVLRAAPPILTRLGERFIDFGVVAYVLIQRFDGNLIDGGGGAMKYLTNTY